MSYKRVRAYLFSKSYACTIFQTHISAAKLKDKKRLKVRIEKILLFGQTLHNKHFSNIGSVVRKDEKLSIYICIEKELTLLVIERGQRKKFDLEEYEYALLDPAIERVAGASLAKIENDRTFDMELIARKKLYQHWYYQTAAKYRLPTLRIIPFLLRLLH